MEIRFTSGARLSLSGLQSRGQWYHWEEVPPANGSAGNSSCNVLLADSDVEDGSIPLILGVSFAAWLVCVVIFLVIRYCATDYSRVGLTTSSQWLTAVYNRKRDSVSEDDLVQSRRSKTASTLLFEDDHWYTWVVNLFWRLRVSDVGQRCGPDATVYLSMELYIMLLLCVFSLLSVCVVLPVNYLSGEIVSGGFPKTTVSNIPPGSGVLWLHTIFSIIYLCVTVVFMIRFTLKLGKFQQENSNHTVMVQWIPRFVHREDIMQHLQEALSNSQVADIQFAYDVSRLTKHSDELKVVTECLEGVDSVLDELGQRETVRPPGWRKLCCCCQQEVDAKTCYEEHYSDLRASIEREKRMIRENKRLGIAFITFKRAQDAAQFNVSYKLCRRKPQSSMYDNVKAQQWWVSLAPFSLDILWENMSVHYLVWWLRWLLINAVLFVFLFFFTTPSILLGSIDEIRVRFVNATHVPDITDSFGANPFLKSYLPPLILLLFASLLPLVVSRSSFIEAHWTRSFREQTIMRKTYIFLLLMVILLPSIGLTSLNAVGELALKGQEAFKSRLSCIYLPNNGAFFVGYVITSTFIGTALELLRLPELALYLYHIARARTRVLKEQALQKAAKYDFMYGVQYAWNLVIFNMVLSFSLTTPIIVPFGLLYFVVKYFTDKYNIYYVYKPAPFNGRQFLHRSAVNFVILGALHLQLATLFFSIVRLGHVNARAAVMIVVFSLFGLTCIGVMSFGWFKHLLPQLRLKMGKEYRVFGMMRAGSVSQDDEEDIESVVKGSYIAPLLKDIPAETMHDGSSSGYGYQSFGSTDCMGRHSPSTSPPSHTAAASKSPPPTIPEGGGEP